MTRLLLKSKQSLSIITSLRATGFLALSFYLSTSFALPAIPGQYVVKLKPGAIMWMMGSLDLNFTGTTIPLSSDSTYLAIHQSPTENPEAALRDLQSSPWVELAEPNYVFELFDAPNDPEYSKAWGLNNTGQPNEMGSAGLAQVDIGIQAAWQIQTGSPKVVVAIIDSGVNYAHPDLKDNMWVNLAEASGQVLVDDDKNGLIDDIYGYDFYNNKADPMDDFGHGSHVASVIGAKGNNGIGSVGVNWNVRMMAIKFTNAQNKGSLEGGVSGIQYAVKMGANIINASWGGSDSSAVLSSAIQDAANKNVLFVAAAGNDGKSYTDKPIFPAAFDVPNIISVASVDQRGRLAWFSSFDATRVHIAAPGDNIWGIWKDTPKFKKGTSTSAPFVAGVAALVLAQEPTLTALQLKDRLLRTVTPKVSLKGKTVSAGIVNAYQALTNQTVTVDPFDPAFWTETKILQVSTTHPYQNDLRQKWVVEIPGAKAISLYIEKYDMESPNDYLEIHDRGGAMLAKYTTNDTAGWTPVVGGDYVRVEFYSDGVFTGYGFDISKAIYTK